MTETPDTTAETPKNPLVRVQEARNELQEAMYHLHHHGIAQAREAFQRLFPELTFPETASTSCFGGDFSELQIHFRKLYDLSLVMGTTTDPETDISFTGMKQRPRGDQTDSVSFSIRVPLKELNDSGIEKIDDSLVVRWKQ